MPLDIAPDTIRNLKRNQKIILSSDSMIHSDQGVHYTSPVFQKQIETIGIIQSMSRRGNCWDNAPQESFFGHLKDEAHVKSCLTLDELNKEIDD